MVPLERTRKNAVSDSCLSAASRRAATHGSGCPAAPRPPPGTITQSNCRSSPVNTAAISDSRFFMALSESSHKTVPTTNVRAENCAIVVREHAALVRLGRRAFEPSPDEFW